MARDQDSYKEKFRPDADARLDAQIDAALGDLSMDKLYGFDKPQSTEAVAQGSRRGKIVSIDKDDAFVDFGGKSQGIVSLIQFDEPPVVGQEMEFNVERYDAAEGLLILTRKGSAQSNVTWETLEVGQIVEGVVTAVNKGGLELTVKNMRAFMPAGQVDIYHVPDLLQFVNQKFMAEVTAFERQGRNIVLSRRNILEPRAGREKDQAAGGTGRGSNPPRNSGGGVVFRCLRRSRRRRWVAPRQRDELPPRAKSRRSRQSRRRRRCENPQDRPRDRKDRPEPQAGPRHRSLVGRANALCRRFARDWSRDEDRKFRRLHRSRRGDRRAYLPIGEISHKRIRTPAEVVKEGDTVRIVVLSVDPVARRMSFSLKQATPGVEEAPPTATAAAPATPKKKRPVLRGGLDF